MRDWRAWEERCRWLDQRSHLADDPRLAWGFRESYKRMDLVVRRLAGRIAAYRERVGLSAEAMVQLLETYDLPEERE